MLKLNIKLVYSIAAVYQVQLVTEEHMPAGIFVCRCRKTFLRLLVLDKKSWLAIFIHHKVV